MSDLILTGDNVNEGRIKINSNLDSLDIYWSAGTGVNSIKSSASNGIYPNFSSGVNSIAFGVLNQALEQNSHAEGLHSVSSGNSSHSQNHKTTAAGDYSHAGGNGDQTYGPTLSLGDCSFSHTEHSTSQTNSGQGALADYSVVLGGRDNSINSNSKKSGIFGGYVEYSNDGDRISNTSTVDACNIIFGGLITKIIDCSHSSIIGGEYNLMENNGAGGMAASTIIGGRHNNMYSSTSSAIIGGGDVVSVGTYIGVDLNILSASTNSAIIGASKSVLIGSRSSVIIAGSGNTIEYRAGFPAIVGNISENCVMVGGLSHGISHWEVNPHGNFNSSIIGGSESFLMGCDNNTIVGGKQNVIGNIFTTDILTASGSTIVGGRHNNIYGYLSASSPGMVIVGGYRNHNLSGMDSPNSILMGTGGITPSANTWSMAYGGSNPISATIANNTIAFNFEVGQGYWDGTPNVGPADYAEYFEWNDSNPSNEDRVGYFTSLNGEKVEIGNANIVGVVSANPAIVGDAAELKWQGIYEKDEWGRKLYGEDRVPIKNSNYNENQNYTPRKDRKEWSPIGLLGKLNVRTSETITGTTISSDSNGMAINGNDYHVLESKKNYDGNYGVVKILFK